MKSRTADSIAAGLFARANEQSGCGAVRTPILFFGDPATVQPVRNENALQLRTAYLCRLSMPLI